MNGVIIVFLVALSFGLLVVGHEFGHFIVAKINGVKVEEFAVGMGPLICKFQGKETMYSLRLLPIGGYVRMLGEYDESENDVSDHFKDRAYIFKHPLRKISIILAGPVMNFILAFAIFWGIVSFHGYNSMIVGEVRDGSPAYKSGIMVGDEIVSLNFGSFLNWNDFVYKLQNLDSNESINIGLIRDGEKLNFIVEPEVEGNSIIIGIAPKFVSNVGFGEGVVNGFKRMIFEVKQVVNSLVQLITGKVSVTDLGGPVTIFKFSGYAAQQGILQLMNFTAFLSINLGVFNLIPFPALDGGTIIVNLVELISKKKIKQEILAKINFVGFSLLILFMIFVTLKDIFFPLKF